MQLHCVRIYVDYILDEVPDDISDEEYDNKIEGPYLKFCNFMYDKLAEPYNGRSPIWFVIIDGKFKIGEGYSEIPDFQGREEKIVQIIEQAISK